MLNSALAIHTKSIDRSIPLMQRRRITVAEGIRSAAVYRDGVDIRRTTLDFEGLGLFATRRFVRGDYITEFTGPRISHTEANDGRPTSHIRSITGIIEAIDGYRDPQEVINIGAAQFANDGTRMRLNNARMVNVNDPSTVIDRCFLRALRTIEPGEEIFTPYGRGYWQMSREEQS